MAYNFSPKIITDGLIICLDAANTRSYPGSGTTWSDLSRGESNGILINGPTFSSDGRGSIVFDGVNDYVNLGNKDTFTNPNGFSINIWFKPSTYSETSSAPLAEKYQASGLEFVFGSLSTNLFAWVYDNNTNGYRGRYLTNMDSFAPRNVWSNFVYTYDGQGLTSSSKIYINGMQRDTTDFTAGTFTTIRNTPTPLSIGRFNQGIGGPIKGNVGIFNFFNKTLTVSEILQNYNATKTRFGL
jgi:hypothetical protein